MGVVVFVLLVAGAGVGVVGTYVVMKHRYRPYQRNFLLVWQETSWRLTKCTAVPGGVESNGVTYPATDTLLLPGTKDNLYILAVDSVALLTHEALDKRRGSILKGAVFAPHSKLDQMAKPMAIILAVLFFLYVVQGFGGVSGELADLRADIGVIKEIVLMMRATAQ